jgi:hypothetical protein
MTGAGMATRSASSAKYGLSAIRGTRSSIMQKRRALVRRSPATERLAAVRRGSLRNIYIDARRMVLSEAAAE